MLHGFQGLVLDVAVSHQLGLLEFSSDSLKFMHGALGWITHNHNTYNVVCVDGQRVAFSTLQFWIYCICLVMCSL